MMNLTFLQAVEIMAGGGRVRRPFWGEGYYICMELTSSIIVDNIGDAAAFYIDDFMANDYEEVFTYEW